MGRTAFFFLVFLLVVGCGGADGPAPPAGDSDTDADTDADTDSDADTDADTDADSDADCVDVWQFRTGADTIRAGGQDYRCWQEDAPASGYAVRISPIVPEDDESVVHHLVLMRGSLLIDCMAAEAFNPIVFGGGLGTDTLVTPPGVGIPVDEGDGYILQFHITNGTDEDVEFDVGVEMCLVPSVEHEAALVTWGPSSLYIPDDGEPHTFEDDCPVTREDRTFFAAFGHMHQLGTRTEIGLDGEPFAIIDPWDFTDQPMVHLDPQIVASPGQNLTVSCTYVNPRGNGDVDWGPYSEDEMCLPSAYYWPAGLSNCFDFGF